MPKLNFKNSIIFLLVVITIVAFLFLPVKIPYTIAVSGKLFPEEEWILSKGTDGRLISQVKDNLKGHSRNYAVSLFERGDIITFKLLPALCAGFSVQKDDTVGFIHSNEVQRNLITLRGQLQVKQAELEMYRSGEKESLVLMARQNLATAQKKAKMQRQILARKKELFERNLVSREKYELEQTKTEVLEADIELASARLSSLLEGAKEEQLSYIRSQIFALEQELKVYQQRQQSAAILAPINGVVTSSFSTDTMLHVLKTEQLVLVLPLELHLKKYVTDGQQIFLDIPGAEEEQAACIVSVSTRLFNLAGRQVFLVTAKMSNDAQAANPGQMVRGAVQSASLSPAEYLKRYLKELFN